MPGARLAPYHVRRVSALVQGYHPVHGLDVFSALRCADGGNVVFPPFDREVMRAAVEAEIGRLAAAGVAPVVVGGDHSVTLAGAADPLETPNDRRDRARAARSMRRSILIGNTVRRLLEAPERWDAIVHDPALIPAAIDESLRFDPSVPVWRRVTTRPASLAGVELPRGARLFLWLAAANRDASVFPEPERFDLHRHNADQHRRARRRGRGGPPAPAALHRAAAARRVITARRRARRPSRRRACTRAATSAARCRRCARRCRASAGCP